MWFSSFLPMVLLASRVLGSPEPGELRVPKVYNAVITSNQNLAPSRAYPVIQPIIHRTAIGYVPPFYYSQIAPGFAGPGVVQLDPVLPKRPDNTESVETSDNADSPTNKSSKRISRPVKSKSANDEFSKEELDENSDETTSSDKRNKKKDNDERVPLNFYPNYRSVYYDPYFYPYNAFPPHLATPGTYYVDYPHTPGILGPIPPPLPLQPGPGIFSIPAGRPDTSPPNDDNDRDNANRNEKQKTRTTERRDRIPHIPIPPFPIIMEKKNS